jgi:hypothetical protein
LVRLKGQGVLQRVPRLREFPEPIPRAAHRMMRDQQGGWVVETLGEGQEFSPELPRRSVLGAIRIDRPQGKQDPA